MQALNSAGADSDGLNDLGVRLPVRVVVTNILAEIIVLFTDDVYRALEAGGKYVVSGVIEEKRRMVELALVESGFRIEEVYSDQGWVAIIAGK
ncbi:MAG: ribosomal protein methyltransferase [Paenibacillaceae bacterium]|nr:ribosomal protein methyltransferase [Paenibacillaceae bacterium]